MWHLPFMTLKNWKWWYQYLLNRPDNKFRKTGVKWIMLIPQHTGVYRHTLGMLENTPDNLEKSLCRASLDARGVRILSIHWYSGSSFTTSSSTNPLMTCIRYPDGTSAAEIFKSCWIISNKSLHNFYYVLQIDIHINLLQICTCFL